MSRYKSDTGTAHASAARTATGNTESAGIDVSNFDEVVAYLDVTAASGTSPTLDVDYEVSPDAGSTWYTHTSFTQATATTSERKVLTRPVGVKGRFKYTIGGTSPSFTFSIKTEGKKEGS